MPPRPRTYTWEWWFDATPSKVWPLVADTNRLDRLAGLPAATYAHRAAPGKDHVLDVRQTFGGFTMNYVEDPYEWVEDERYSVERRFTSGPVTAFRWRVSLVPEARGTKVVAQMTVEPRSKLSAWLVPVMAKNAKKGLDRAFRTLEGETRGGRVDLPPTRAVATKVLARLARAGASIPADVATRLADHLACADASDLRRVRPFALADAWKRPRREVLAAFLHAVRAGVLELHWEPLCPHCRSSEHPARTLTEVRSTNRCDACGIDFDVEFDRSLEAVFRPAADLRRIGPEIYCLGGPGNTPHVVAQARVPANGEVRLEVALEAGAHRVRGGRREGAVVVHVEDGQAHATSAAFVVGERGVTASGTTLSRGRVTLSLRNDAPTEGVVVVERVRWLDDVVTALDVVGVPGFQDLFADEVLAPGERVAVRRISILFTDLKGSTAIYRRMGDAPAYALVRAHFEVLRQAIARRDGILVKTIGDAVMASFRSPADAIAAAVDMHRAVAALPTPEGTPALVLKAGVHEGPAIAVTSGGRLDFFGTTSNLAARAQHESHGGDVVATEDVLADADVRRLLADVPHRNEPFRARLKGFDDEVPLHRVVLG